MIYTGTVVHVCCAVRTVACQGQLLEGGDHHEIHVRVLHSTMSCV